MEKSKKYIIYILLLISIFLNLLFIYKLNNFTTEVYPVGYYESPSQNISLNVYKDNKIEIQLGDEIINSEINKIEGNVYKFTNQKKHELLIFKKESVRLYNLVDNYSIDIPKILNENVKKINY